MIIKLNDGSSLQFLKKDLKLLKSVMTYLRKFILSLLKNGYSGPDFDFFSTFKNGNNVKIEDIVFSCLPNKIKCHLSGLRVYNFPSISCDFNFKKKSGIPLKYQDIIVLEVSKILNEENRKLISKIPSSVQKGSDLLRRIEENKLKLKKRFDNFQKI